MDSDRGGKELIDPIAVRCRTEGRGFEGSQGWLLFESFFLGLNINPWVV